jgi:hypothetical protein
MYYQYFSWRFLYVVIKLPPYNRVIFFEVATREALFLRRETVDKLPDLIDDLDARWYAKVVDDTLLLRTFPPKDVFAMCQREPCFFFYGRTDGSSFKSHLSQWSLCGQSVITQSLLTHHHSLVNLTIQSASCTSFLPAHIRLYPKMIYPI